MNESQFILTAIGLILDIVGVILLFIFGLTPGLNLENHEAVVTKARPEQEKKRKRYNLFSKLGLILLILGFLLQIIALLTNNPYCL